MTELLKDIFRDLRLPKPPFWMVSILLIGVALSWVPLAIIAKARVTRSSDPPIHIFQDMDNQPRPRAQQASDFFADGRSMRPVVTGTVPRGEVLGDEHYTQGYTITEDDNGNAAVKYLTGFPDRLSVDEKFLDRGQRQFNIFCSHCHGGDGRGNGMVNQRALALVGAGALNSALPKTEWATVANLHEVLGEAVENAGELRFGHNIYPEGQLYNTITNGKGNMGPLGSQITIEDRWAIVAYVRALQAAGNVPVDQLTSKQRQKLEK